MAQIIWGCFPIYVDLLKDQVSSFDFVGHRIVWSFTLLAGCLLAGRILKVGMLPKTQPVFQAIASFPVLRLSIIAATLIAINWLTFVWSVNHEHKVDASLGYYICPQIVVLLGVIFLGERLSLTQWTAVALAAVGVGYMVWTSSGAPWIAAVIAVSFGLYGLAKKKIKLGALEGLTIETGFLFIPALAYLIYRQSTGASLFCDTVWQNALVLGTGVATITPLALYATSLKHIPLSTVGLLQFIGPTLQFLIGVLLYEESFEQDRLVGFCIVWFGIALFLSEKLRKNTTIQK